MGAITSYTLTAPLLATDTIVFDRSGDTKSGVLGAMAPFSALTLVADRLPYGNGSGTMALATFTAAGRALLDDADAAAQCTTLGLGTGDSPQFTAVNIGHASDTTITRASAGDINVEGNIVYRAGGTDVPVADGGTGRSTSTTAYGLIAAGTTATGAHQTLAAGATTEILVGGGASALPAWTTATGTGAPARAGSPTFTGTVTLAALTAAGTIAINGDFNIVLTPSTLTSTTLGARPGSLLLIGNTSTIGFGQDIVWGTQNSNTYRYAAVSSYVTTNNGTGAVGHIIFSTKTTDAATTLTERMRIASDGVVSIQNLLDLSGAAAGQIKFPAAQNASADANTLDDYEEGTFTPVLKFGGATTGITYGVQSGVYTKVGNKVTISLQISLSSKGSATGSATITGLPFTNAALQKALANILATLTLTGSFQTVVAASGTSIDMSQQASGTSSQITDAHFNNASVLVITGTYTI